MSLIDDFRHATCLHLPNNYNADPNGNVTLLSYSMSVDGEHNSVNII